MVTAHDPGSPDPLSSPATATRRLSKTIKAEPVTSGSQGAPNPKRGPGRPRKVIPASSESPSSALTSMDSSEDGEFSISGTSKVPTPAADGPAVSKVPARSSIQVQLPARSSSNLYALNPTSNCRTREIQDSEDEFSDSSPDAKTARCLHAQLNGGGDYGSYRQAKPQKRHRASTSASQKNDPPAKKPKTSAQLDLDAELAAGAGFQSDQSFTKQLGASSNPVILGSESSDEDLPRRTRQRRVVEDSDEEIPLTSRPKATSPPYSSSDEDMPLSSRMRNIKTIGKPGILASKPSSAPVKKITRGRADPHAALQALDSEDGDGLSDIEVDSIDSATYTSTASLQSATNAASDGEIEARARDRQWARVTQRRAFRISTGNKDRIQKERDRLEKNHPEVTTMWAELESMPIRKAGKATQPKSISRQLKGFQLEGLAWMLEMEKTAWRGGLLGDEMGLGKTIQAVSLVMSDYPAKQPSLVLVPPVALMQWQSEINAYTDGTLKTFVYHSTNQKTKGMTVKDLKKFDVIMMSYNSLESMYRKQEKGFTRKTGIYKEKSLIHAINFHRIILDEAHSIKTRTTMTAKACFALKTDFRWCLTGTPLQNRIGEFFSLIRFLNVRPFACYLCKQCPCSTLEWSMNEDSRCSHCNHSGMQHVSVFNQELLNPIQKFGNLGPGREAFRKLRLMTDHIMLRRLKKDHTNAMELPVKETYVDRQFFGEEENDFANSIMTSAQRKFDTYVAQGVLLNNYANIFGLIMQMRQIADHPDLITKKHAEGGQNVLVCCICDEPAEDTVRSRCKHDFCRACVTSYVRSTETPDCPRCHIPLSIDLEQPEIEQDKALLKKTSIINRIKMENWTSSSKIELLVHDLHKLRSNNASHKSIIFSQFTTMLQLIEWRLRRAGISTVMLDGSMSPAQRQASTEHFMNNVDVECFLVSMKAGGVALNLTEASRVFIVDPWWNPAAEWQSADRCHRIGQTRPCVITRLCIEDSVESRMVFIQEKKTSMIHSTVNSDDKAMDALTPDDLQFLFRGS